MATIAVLSALPVSSVQGVPVIEGVTVSASSWWDMPGLSYQHPGNLVNNKGMAVPYDITATHDPHGDADGQWHALDWPNDPNPVLTFDLGGPHNLDGIHIWNGNQGRAGQDNTGRGVDSFTVSISKDGTNFVEAFTGNLARSPFVDNNVGPVSAQHFNLAGHNDITHVRIRVNSIHDPGNPYPGLSEVMFTAESAPLRITRFEVSDGRVTLAFTSEAGEVFDIYRSVDLETGLDVPLVADLPASGGVVVVESFIDDFSGGLTLGDSTVNFGSILVAGTTYALVPATGLNDGNEVAVVSWVGNTITLSEDIGSDLTWNGDYKVQTPLVTETAWVDPSPPEGEAFYQVRRQ